MTQTRWTTVALALAVLTFVVDAAYAQVSLRVRGTITGLNDNILSVKTREGKDLKLQLSDKTVVVAAIKLEELEPGSMITNGNVAGAVEYQGGSQTVLVPAGTPIVTNVPADRSALRPGEYIFTSAAVAADGTLTVQRIQVSRDGVKPPQ